MFHTKGVQVYASVHIFIYNLFVSIVKAVYVGVCVHNNIIYILYVHLCTPTLKPL